MKTLDTWNLKQLFMYVEVEWPEKTIIAKQVVWDKIMPRAEIKDSFQLSDTFKYPINDHNLSLRGRTVKFNIWTELMPIFGIITRVRFSLSRPAIFWDPEINNLKFLIIETVGHV
jgi:hypothetical protein